MIMRHDQLSVNKDVYIRCIDNLPINWFWAWIMSMQLIVSMLTVAKKDRSVVPWQEKSLEELEAVKAW